MNLKGKKILLMGLGILGGGIATARWLYESGARLTITDMKDATALKPALDRLSDISGKINFVLGKHEEKDFVDNEIIVVNPDVPTQNPFLELARLHNKQIENELTLFYRFGFPENTISVTGTRGKTTTTHWIHHFLKLANQKSLIMGNNPEKPLLQEIKSLGKNTPVAIEEPSFLLELLGDSGFASHVAVITNLYRDHLNRHKTMEEYARIKSLIFANQSEKDFVILNRNNGWTPFFLGQKPKSKILFFSLTGLDDMEEGIYVNGRGEIIVRINGAEEKLMNAGKFVSEWGEHNLENLLASTLVVFVFGISLAQIRAGIETLPGIHFRQEKVYDKNGLEIYNDTTATTPEATIVALARFAKNREKLILISGGTDRDLDFSRWAEEVKKHLKPENLILLAGSATEKMKAELGWENFQEFENLEECFDLAREKVNQYGNGAIILFSPSSKSFEKFKNEFDRGERFNKLVTDI